jgi:hypothetical protein
MPDPLDLLIRDLSRIDARARVGALDEENATKLHHSEFGTLHAPPRPTLSAATDRAEGDIHAAIKRRLLGVIDSTRTIDGKTILGEVGGMLAEQVKEAIGNNTPPNPLAPPTLAARRRRGNESTRTLVDTGDMQASITVETKASTKGWAE